ncbi:MAG: acyltransferase [Niastella sp.]|nr:acyltransferase [Niastella sp.]
MELISPLKKATPNKYYKYLDSFRFIAVMLVIFFHWLPEYFQDTGFGKLGVDMFFVLSGFLISQNLLLQKENIKSSINLFQSFKTFYIRRALRIFPIYYLVVFIFFFLSIPIITDNFIWFIFYLTNYLIIYNEQWLGMFSHLWSLAVEEQFYLFWPAVIFLVPLKYLGHALVGFISFSLIYILLNYYDNSFKIFSLQSCMSTLSMGGLLAFIKNTSSKTFSLRFDVPIFILLFIILMYGILKGFGVNLTQIINALFSFYFIKLLITRENKILDKIFANRITSFFGKISYGLYLYHNFIPWLLRNLNGSERLYVLEKWSIIPEFKNGILIFLSQFLLLVVIAILSWILVEKPLNNLKKNFRYLHG